MPLPVLVLHVHKPLFLFENEYMVKQGLQGTSVTMDGVITYIIFMTKT